MDSFVEFADLFVNLFMLTDQRIRTENQRLTDDLKVHTLEAAYALIQSATTEVIKCCLRDDLFRKALGHSISVLLSVSAQQSSATVRITALKMLQVWLQRSDTLVLRHECSREEVANIYQNYLPGISVAIMKLLSSDDKLPHALICCSVSVLSLEISLSLSQEPVDENSSVKLRETCDNLESIIKRITPQLVECTGTRVRHSVLAFCKQVSENCCRFVVQSLSRVLLEPMLLLVMDEDEDLKNDACNSLSSILLQSDTGNGVRVYEMLEEGALECMEFLMEEFEETNPSQKVRKIQFLAGMFCVLHPLGCNQFMNIPSHRHRFIRSLIRVCSTSQRIRIDGSHRVNDASELKSRSYAWNSDAGRGVLLQQLLRSLLHSVASKVDRSIIQDVFNDLHEHTVTHPEAIFVANQIVEAAPATASSGSKGEILATHFANCLKELEDCCYYCIHSELSGERRDRVMLALEGLWICMNGRETTSTTGSLFGQAFSEHFLSMIYFLLNILTYQDSQTGSSCQKLLMLLASQLHYSSVNDMIRDNSFHLATRFHKDQHFVPSLQTSAHHVKLLQTILSFCSPENIVSFEPLVTSTLTSLESCYTLNPTQLLQSLLVFLKFLSREHSHPQIDFQEPEEREPLLRIHDWHRKWLQFVSDVETSEADPAAEVSDAELPDDEVKECTDSPLQPKDLPTDAQMAKMIIEKCSNLLSLPESEDQILVLGIICEAAIILKDYEDIFLPFVHRIWKQLVLRLSDEVAVARSAFELLFVLSRTCGDFIEKRVTSDVLPKIRSFLSQHSEDGMRKETRVGHRFTITFQHQRECLQKIASLTMGMRIGSRELWKLIRVVLMYIRKDQTEELKNAAGQALRLLRSQDPDAVCFYCQQHILHSPLAERNFLLHFFKSQSVCLVEPES